ncbi:MAG: hypothetical protein PUJ85_03310 [bacterium]|nr:hypothetical protein [bacterium]
MVHSKHYTELEDKTYVADSGKIIPQGISLINPKVCSVILCNYSKLKGDSEDAINSDLYYLM